MSINELDRCQAMQRPNLKNNSMNQTANHFLNTTIGEGATIGAGAVINDQISIGKHSFIGAGAVVTKDIPDNVIAYGTPAKVIKKIP